ncbi:serine-type D-Ala-D-Ala carboxypeptidase [Streptococcus ictaluri 707-05]|uniref:Serine-type D-Ala-D-Ala carboxypeptidase n=1 Tax=Streptococcus ictaluri 707-05 TaxID=764299 RepID=G5K021_9STRE|nr:serine-type D-Ala-D-Ala carboxypeptidase [Streptococcus ictaluri 707-05]
MVVVLFLSGIYLFVKPEKEVLPTPPKKENALEVVAKPKETALTLPKVSPDDWQLVLVNREHIKEEMSPELMDVNGISVDKRIEQAVADFLAAAQAIDPQEHLISGYRSVAYQEELYQSYLAQEMANDPNLTQKAAEALVQTYSQPAGASEHLTGLAIDMSTVDSLNASDPVVAKEVQKMAPQFGFVLRFPEGKEDITGVGYEDWHYRFVGKRSANYMTQHKLTLEEYIAQLKENQ